MSDHFIPDVALSDNTSQRLPCVILLDGSSSMSRKLDGISAVNELNAGLKVLEQELKADDMASQRVQLMVVRIGGSDEVQVVTDWTDAIDFVAPEINAKGTTPLGAGARYALQTIEEQKENYRSHGIPYNRPWLFFITDGGPTDPEWEDAALECRMAEAEGKVVVFLIGTGSANFEKISRFSTRAPVRMAGLNFSELFVWLSRSASSGSQNAPGSEFTLPEISWGETV
jgi:uncharacterized protein YegL